MIEILNEVAVDEQVRERLLALGNQSTSPSPLCFKGDGQVVNEALDSIGGFVWVFAGVKALLEHNHRAESDRRCFSERA